MAYSDGDGELAVRIARDAVESHVRGRPLPSFTVPASFNEKAGAFITLNTHPEGHLRGCIGYPSPLFPLVKSVVRAAEGACEDPRFPALQEDELGRIVVEASLLTNPVPLQARKPKEFPREIAIGTDGLSVHGPGGARGLLLPQVPVEWGWDADEFLSQACMKAGLMPDAWLDDDVRVYKFQAEIFTEVEPRGPVMRRDLAAEHARR